MQTGIGDALSHPNTKRVSALRSNIAPCENDRATVSSKVIKSKNGHRDSVTRFGDAGDFVTKCARLGLRPCARY